MHTVVVDADQPTGEPFTYRWSRQLQTRSQFNGYPSLANATAPHLQLQGLVSGSYTYQVDVMDAVGAVVSSTVEVVLREDNGTGVAAPECRPTCVCKRLGGNMRSCTLSNAFSTPTSSSNTSLLWLLDDYFGQQWDAIAEGNDTAVALQQDQLDALALLVRNVDTKAQSSCQAVCVVGDDSPSSMLRTTAAPMPTSFQPTTGGGQWRGRMRCSLYCGVRKRVLMLCSPMMVTIMVAALASVAIQFCLSVCLSVCLFVRLC